VLGEMPVNTRFVNEDHSIDSSVDIAAEICSHYTFQSMAAKIGSCAKISPDLITAFGERAIKSWEMDSHANIADLYKLNTADRSEKINELLNYFRNFIEDMGLSGKIIDKIMTIASVSHELLFSERF
jgi:hypothetical protein